MPALSWFPFYFDARYGGRDLAGKNFAIEFDRDWQRMKDYQRGWFMQLLIHSLRSEAPGYLEVSRENLWRLAGAHRRDHFERNGSELVSCFQIAQVSRRSVVFYEPLVKVIEQQTRKLKTAVPSPDQQELQFSTVSTEIHTGASPPLSLSFSESGFDFKKKKGANNFRADPEIPTLEQVTGYCQESRITTIDPFVFVNYYAARGWLIGGQPMSDWRAAVRTWAARETAGKKPNRAEQRLQDNLAANARAKARLRVQFSLCARHPESGRTPSGKCWGCYVEEVNSA